MDRKKKVGAGALGESLWEKGQVVERESRENKKNGVRRVKLQEEQVSDSDCEGSFETIKSVSQWRKWRPGKVT